MHTHTHTNIDKCTPAQTERMASKRYSQYAQKINKCNHQLVTNISQCALFTSSWLRSQVHGSINTFSPETGQSLITSFRCQCAGYFHLGRLPTITYDVYIHPTSNIKTQRKREKNNIKLLHIGFSSTRDDFNIQHALYNFTNYIICQSLKLLLLWKTAYEYSAEITINIFSEVN